MKQLKHREVYGIIPHFLGVFPNINKSSEGICQVCSYKGKEDKNDIVGFAVWLIPGDSIIISGCKECLKEVHSLGHLVDKRNNKKRAVQTKDSLCQESFGKKQYTERHKSTEEQLNQKHQ